MKFRFDGGTVLLEAEQADGAACRLPGLRWDARVGAFRAPGSAWPRIRDALGATRAEGIRTTALVRDGWSDIDLRPYQEAALMAWELGGRRGIVTLPTGSGKTRVALAAMARTGLSTLCMVPTRVLVDDLRGFLARTVLLARADTLLARGEMTMAPQRPPCEVGTRRAREAGGRSAMKRFIWTVRTPRDRSECAMDTKMTGEPGFEANGRIGELLQQITDDLKTIARDEVELVKLEVVRSARAAAADAALVLLGGIVALVGLGLLCVAAVAALEPVIGPLWLRMLIMAAVYLAVGGGFAVAFGKRFKRDATPDLEAPAGHARRTVDRVRDGLR